VAGSRISREEGRIFTQKNQHVAAKRVRPAVLRKKKEEKRRLGVTRPETLKKTKKEGKRETQNGKRRERRTTAQEPGEKVTSGTAEGRGAAGRAKKGVWRPDMEKQWAEGSPKPKFGCGSEKKSEGRPLGEGRRTGRVQRLGRRDRRMRARGLEGGTNAKWESRPPGGNTKKRTSAATRKISRGRFVSCKVKGISSAPVYGPSKTIDRKAYPWQ